MASGPKKTVKFPNIWPITKRTRRIPVTATTVFLPIDENNHALEVLAIPGEEVGAEDADICILDKLILRGRPAFNAWPQDCLPKSAFLLKEESVGVPSSSVEREFALRPTYGAGESENFSISHEIASSLVCRVPSSWRT